MIADRFYYGRLNKQEQQVYKALYAGVAKCERKVHTGRLPSPEKSVSSIIQALLMDNPHLYYFNGEKVHYSFSPMGVDFQLEYYFPVAEIQKYNQEIQLRSTQIINTIKANASTEYERCKALYDYFAKHFTYDKAAINTVSRTHKCYAHSMLGLFIQNTAVCEGISKAFKFLMNGMDIKCIVVSGSAKDWYTDGHAWNIVKINGSAYHIDMTWGINMSVHELVRYDYFLITDNIMMKDHGNFSTMPKCRDNSLDYYVRNSLEIDNSIYMKNVLKQMLQQRKTSIQLRMVRGNGKFAFTEDTDIATTVNEAINEAHKEATGEGFEMNIGINQTQRILHVIMKYK